ncbi:hypothetical protein ABT112_01530 [Streptomyces sp. NPDC002055]|uniref:hypothetical protein n=1 Tax=Streptomyces sp. NPDC002055 TaxID=3154534 RepID=UPI0033196EBF
MKSASFRLIAAATTAVVALTTMGVASATTADRPQERPPRARVTGSAEFALPYHPDADVRSFTFDARAVPYSRPIPGVPTGLPTDARGTVKVSHYFAEQHRTVTAEGRVDCLVTGPRTATLTAVITRVDEGGPDWKGRRLGFSVHDGGRDRGRSPDRVGFSWGIVNVKSPGDEQNEGAEAGTCMAPAPYAPVTKGGYTVRHAELPPVPGNAGRAGRASPTAGE